MKPGRTPGEALRRRLVGASVVIVLLLALSLDLALYLGFRSALGGAVGADAVLRKLLVVEAVATIAVAVLAAVLFRSVATAVLRPLEKMLGVVRRQTEGEQGERIRPQPDCLVAELGQAYDDMLDAQERAIADTRAARDRSRRFLADAAHQIRTPIAGIQAGAETLLRRSPSGGPDEEQLLSTMLGETSKVGRLVTDLLQTARLDQGVHLELAPCDLAAVCRHEAARVQQLEPGLAVTTQAPGWNGQRPALDGKAVHNIVANLLDNARRRADSQVKVTVRRTADRIEVRVADDGPELSPEAIEKAFERSTSLDLAHGSGLGLPIAQELARAHGGDVHHQADAFVVTLPWLAEPPPRPARAPSNIDWEPDRARMR